ncbi:Uncharacterised protein [uncultured archaeon]|nr:Uncharacterised protein [uncultured archaeon]
MDKKIDIILISLILLLMIGTMVGTVNAQAQQVSIYVYDSRGNPASGAYITVYQGANEINHHYSDSSGTWTTELNLYTRYIISASLGGQYGDWKGELKGSRISIYMQ